MRRKWIFMAPLALLAFVVFIAVGGLVVQQLWNWLLPGLFGWHQITFWQALAILLLCRILFGGFRLHGPNRPSLRRRWRGGWERMTPEQRERFRQGMRANCGFGPFPSENPGQSTPSSS